MGAFRQGANGIQDGRREAQEGHYLTDAGAGEAFAAGDGGLTFDLAIVKLALPPSGEAQELGCAGSATLLGRLVLLLLLFPALRAGRRKGQELARGHLTLDPADVILLEDAPGAKTDLDGLLHVLDLSGLWLAVYVSNAEVDLELCQVGAASSTVTFGEPTLL